LNHGNRCSILRPSASCAIKLLPLGSVPIAPLLNQVKDRLLLPMSVSPADRQCFYTGDAPRTSTLHSISYYKPKTTMFGSLKKKLSKRSSNSHNDPTWGGANTSSTSPTTQKPIGSRTAGLAPPQDNNQYTSSPATRRPSKFTCEHRGTRS
jgi:hypothetical protein